MGRRSCATRSIDDSCLTPLRNGHVRVIRPYIMVGPIAGPKCQWGSKDFGLGSGRLSPNGFPDARVSEQIPLPGRSALLPTRSQIPGVADASFDGFGAPWSHRGRDCPGIGPEARAE